MNLNRRSLAVATLILTLALAACGGKPATNDTLQPTRPVANNNEGGSEEGGVEAALVTYSNAAQGFAIGYPSPWTRDNSVTHGVKFVGGDDSLTLEFVTPPVGMDAMTYAQNDVAAVATAFPGFKQLSLAASTEVKDAIILGLEANESENDSKLGDPGRMDAGTGDRLPYRFAASHADLCPLPTGDRDVRAGDQPGRFRLGRRQPLFPP